MNGLKVALVVSLLVNVGVLAGAGYVAWRHEPAAPPLPEYLALTEAQRQQWATAEGGFSELLADLGAKIAEHRERMIREIFGEAPDRAVIEEQRGIIAAFQQAQQQHVIEQLLREAQILDAGQRSRIVDLLVRDSPPVTPVDEQPRRR